MMLKKSLFFIFIFLMTMFCQAQNIVFEYDMKTVPEKPKNYDNPQLCKELQKAQRKLHKKTGVVIGHCPETMVSELPQSPLSNFLTDILVEIANDYCQKHHKPAVDFSLLNFGGIRSSLNAGDITIGNIFEIAPFENSLVIIELKGSEIYKIFRRFTVKKCEPYSKQINIAYAGEYFDKILLHGQKIEIDKSYRMVTLDFIMTGGDGILKDINFSNVESTGIVVRDAYISHIKKMTAEGKDISGKIDNRMTILPQP